MFLLIGNINAQYCSATASSSNYEWIKSVRVSTSNNYSGSSSGYQDFTSNTPMNLITGECHNFEVQAAYSGTEYPEYFGIWIDLNNDDDFFDAGENIFLSSTSIVGGVGSNIVIPSTATLGQTRMRVIMNYNSNLMPCGSFAYGEVEDYTVNILSSDPFCNSSGNSTAFEYIESVSINNVHEFSGDNGGYNINLCAPFYLNMGMSNSVELTPGYYGSSEYPEGWTIWIDYNKNNSFENNELVHKDHTSYGTQTFNLYVRPEAIPGEIYRMRISMQYSNYQLNPCANFSYGEVEDYIFVALDPLGVANLSEDNFSTRDHSADEEISNITKISISPNPASDFIQINTFNNSAIPKTYRIINGSGQLMEASSQNRSGHNSRIDILDYPNGYYILQIKTMDTWESIPFVVSH